MQWMLEITQSKWGNVIYVDLSPGNDGYHGKYCGCRTPDHGCGKAQGHGNPKCRQDQSSATGTSYCACNPGWSKEDCSCSDR